jgi:hypothetical protein
LEQRSPRPVLITAVAGRDNTSTPNSSGTRTPGSWSATGRTSPGSVDTANGVPTPLTRRLSTRDRASDRRHGQVLNTTRSFVRVLVPLGAQATGARPGRGGRRGSPGLGGHHHPVRLPPAPGAPARPPGRARCPPRSPRSRPVPGPSAARAGHRAVLVGSQSGRCVDVPSTTNGARARLWTCHGGANQRRSAHP